MKENRMMQKGNDDIADDFQRVADRVSVTSITGNMILSGFKLIAGIAAHSILHRTYSVR